MSDITESGPSPSSRGTRSSGDSVGVDSVVPGWQTTQTLQLLQELVDVAGSVPPAVARRAGLSTSELHSLRHLMEGPQSPGDLARALGVTSAASSGVVDRLVSHGHAERRPHGLDGRRTDVVITDTGRQEVFALLAPMFTALAALDRSLGERDREVVDRYLQGAISALQTLV